MKPMRLQEHKLQYCEFGFCTKKQKNTEARLTRRDVVAVTRDPLLVCIEIFQFLCQSKVTDDVTLHICEN